MTRIAPFALGLAMLFTVSNAGAQTLPPASRHYAFTPLVDRLWLSGQVNLVMQGNGRFRSPYAGMNSFRSVRSAQASQVMTLYAGVRVTNETSLLFTAERTGGGNLNRAMGLAGFPNLDTVGIPDSKPYIARALLHRSFRLGEETVELSRGPLQLAPTAAVPQLDIYVGKYSIPDFFDVNSVGGDPHYQFLNWAINNNATYNYAADIRGYTYGAVVEIHHRHWTARFGEALQAKTDNPNRTDFRFSRSHSEHGEVEVPLSLVSKRVGIMRVLAYRNRGELGLYRDAIAAYQSAQGQPPDITAHRVARHGFGFGLNWEQELTSSLRGYARLGWSDGETESRNYTEADRAASAGFDIAGSAWHRAEDKLGFATAASGLSRSHYGYLAAGGIGSVLGDGRLHYGTERLMEAYYTAKVARGVHLSVDLQRVANPGYNRDRGPVLVAGVRLHMETWVLKAPK